MGKPQAASGGVGGPTELAGGAAATAADFQPRCPRNVAQNDTRRSPRLPGDSRPIRDRAHCREHRTTRQNDDRRPHGDSAERHLGARPPGGVTRTGEHKIGDRHSSGPDDRTS